MRFPQVKESQYLVLARVVLGNNNSDAQNAFAELYSVSDQLTFDRADVRLLPGDEPAAQSVSLLAQVPGGLLDPSWLLELRCGTFQGFAVEGRVYAVPAPDGFQKADA
jgi:hypothetical protein